MAFLEPEEVFHSTPVVKKNSVASVLPLVTGSSKINGKKAPPGYFRHKTGKMAETLHPPPCPVPLE
jgi:hypothetical protein